MHLGKFNHFLINLVTFPWILEMESSLDPPSGGSVEKEQGSSFKYILVKQYVYPSYITVKKTRIVLAELG